jgi:hypothetical protein
MPEEKIKTTEKEGAENLQTDAPIDERDEVKQAEQRTQQLHEKADNTDLKQKDKDLDA